jgi:hypothetical protein
MVKVDVATTLEYKDKRPDKYKCTLRITREQDLNKLFSIFNKYTLNGVKYLDYVSFLKAHNLYFRRGNGTLTEELTSQILKLKK